MDIIDEFIKYTKSLGPEDGHRFEKASGPVMMCFHFALINDKIQIDKTTLEMRTYRTPITISPDMEIHNVFPDILNEINKIYRPLSKVYVYEIYTKTFISTGMGYPQEGIYIRTASPHRFCLAEDEMKRVTNEINKNGIIQLLKDYGDIMKNEPYLRYYIKSHHSQHVDQMRLWEILQGLEITKTDYSQQGVV